VVVIAVAGSVGYFLYRRRKLNGDTSRNEVDLTDLPAQINQREQITEKLESMLLEDGFGIAKAISKSTAVTESDRLAKDLVTVFEDHNKTVELIKAHISIEVKQASKYL
jgi:hypothetical protein